MESKFSFFFRKMVESAISVYENEVEHPYYRKFLWQAIDEALHTMILNCFPIEKERCFFLILNKKKSISSLLQEKDISLFESESVKKYFLSIKEMTNIHDEEYLPLRFSFLSYLTRESQELFLMKLLPFVGIDTLVIIAHEWVWREVFISLLKKELFKVRIDFMSFLDLCHDEEQFLYDKIIGNPLNINFTARRSGVYTLLENLTSGFCNIGLKCNPRSLGEMLELFDLSIGIGCSIFPREGNEHYSPKILPYLIYSTIHRGEKKGYYSLPDESLSEEEFKEVAHLKIYRPAIEGDSRGYYCTDLDLARGLLTFVKKIIKVYSFIHSISRRLSKRREEESVFSLRESTVPFDKIHDWGCLPITKKTLLFSTTFSEKNISNKESILLSEKREISFLFEEENATIVEVREWLFPQSGDDFPSSGGALPDLVLAIVRQDSIFLKYRSDTS